MLQFIRDRAQGWIAWLIVGLLIIPFALWGINQYFTGEGQAQVARVNDTSISLREYQRALAFQRDRIRSMMGAQANADMIDRLVRPQDVVQSLVENEVLVQAAQDAGFGVSERDLTQQIKSIEAFQRDGQFSKEQYEQLLRAQGDSTASFEQRLRHAIMTNQMRTGVADTVIVSDYDLDQYIRMKNQQREFQHAVIASKNYEAEVELSDEDITKYYETNLNRYMDPEQVRLEYVELKADDLKSKVTISEEEIAALYDEEKSRFGIDEERKARHILINLASDADESAKTEAMKKATDLVARLRAGEDFTKLAKEHSADPGSAGQGGDLGFFGKGTMAPAFEEAAFSLQKGAVSEPVQTSFGLHIIRVDEIREATIKPLKQVRDELVDLYKTRKSELQYYDIAEDLATTAYDNSESLAAVVDQLGLPIKETTWFSRSGGAPGIAGEQKVRTAAFAEDVLKKGYNSEPLEVGVNHVVVVRVKEHRPTAQKPFESIKEQIRQTMVKEQAQQKAAAAGETLLADLTKGAALADVAKANKLVLTEAKKLGRTGQEGDPKIGEALFRMAKAADKGAFQLVALSNGDQALLELTAVVDGDPAAVSKEEKEKIRKELAQRLGNTNYDQYVEALKAKADIAMFLENIQ